MHVEHRAQDPLRNSILLNFSSHHYYLTAPRAAGDGPRPPSSLPRVPQLTCSLSCGSRGLSQFVSVCPVSATQRICLSLISPPSLERRNEVMSGKDL